MHWLREWIKAQLLKRNCILSRPPGQFEIDGIKLAAAKRRGLEPKMIVDGGAAEGVWTLKAKEIWPNAQLLCVEPRESSQAVLRSIAERLPGIHVAQTRVGASEGTVDFFEHSSQSSMLKDAHGQEWGKKVSAPITTLDALLMKLRLPDPDFIKLDLQGAELNCLRGAPRCLAHAEAVLLEVTTIPFQRGMPLVAEVVPFMSQHGFRLYDIVSLWHRPLDGALTQGDWLFVRETSKLLADPRWA